MHCDKFTNLYAILLLPFIPYDSISVWRHHLKVAVYVNSEESSQGFGTQPVFNINYKEHPKADCWICWWAIVLESKRLYKFISHDSGCINMHILPLDMRKWRQGKKVSEVSLYIHTHTVTFVDSMSLWCKFWHFWQLCILWVMALPFTKVKNSGKNIIQ